MWPIRLPWGAGSLSRSSGRWLICGSPAAGGDQRGERVLVEEPRNRRLIIARKRRRPVQAHRSGNV